MSCEVGLTCQGGLYSGCDTSDKSQSDYDSGASFRCLLYRGLDVPPPDELADLFLPVAQARPRCTKTFSATEAHSLEDVKRALLWWADNAFDHDAKDASHTI